MGYAEESPCCPRSDADDVGPGPPPTPRPTNPPAPSDSCVECTNIPTAFMVETSQSCATYDFAFLSRCSNPGSWWGVDGATRHCAYSCWKNGVGYAEESPCCARSDADDPVLAVWEDTLTGGSKTREGGEETNEDKSVGTEGKNRGFGLVIENLFGKAKQP